MHCLSMMLAVFRTWGHWFATACNCHTASACLVMACSKLATFMPEADKYHKCPASMCAAASTSASV